MNSIKKNFHPINADLENAEVNCSSSSGFGPTAADLLKHATNFPFFRLIYFMCVILAIISELTFTFVKSDLDISLVKNNSNFGCIEKVKTKT